MILPAFVDKHSPVEVVVQRVEICVCSMMPGYSAPVPASG